MQTIALPFQQQDTIAKEPVTNVNDICRLMDDFQITRIDTDIVQEDTNEDTDTPTTASTNDDSHQVYRFKLAPSVQDAVTSFAKVPNTMTERHIRKHGSSGAKKMQTWSQMKSSA